MIIAWLIGVILSVLILWALKHSTKTTYTSCLRTEVPVLRMWQVILVALSNLLPIFNIIMAIIFSFWWLFDFDIRFNCPESKLLKFLNKRIQ